MIEEVTSKQIGRDHGWMKTKQDKKNREESRQKEAGVKVACKRHRRQEGIQEVKPRNKREISQGQPRIIRVGKEKQPHTYRKKRTRTTSAPHSEIKMKVEGKGDSNQTKQGAS